MEVKNILLFLIVVFLLIIVIRYIMRDVNTLTGLISGKTMQKIEAADLASSTSSGNTYGTFIYLLNISINCSLWIFTLYKYWNYYNINVDI